MIDYNLDIPLADLLEGVCSAHAIAVVERPSAYKMSDLLMALTEVESALCPFPAKYIRSWFWGTRAGQTVCLAQWQAYRDEAMFPNSVIRFIWGQRLRWTVAHLDKLIKKGELKIYSVPHVTPSKYLTAHENYFRYGEVLAYYKANKDRLAEVNAKWHALHDKENVDARQRAREAAQAGSV